MQMNPFLVETFLPNQRLKEVTTVGYPINPFELFTIFAKLFEKMRIEHLAIWANDIEELRAFYLKYFGATSNERYFNPTKNFQSYFISFGMGCRLELMQKPEIPQSQDPAEATGITHFAISLGSEEAVNALTETLRSDGHRIVGEPRWTGDGYFESVVLDPEGNRIEICA